MSATVATAIPTRYLDAKGAACYLGMTVDAVYTAVQRRLIPFRRLNTKLVFDSVELDEYMRRLEGVGVDEAVARVQHGGTEKDPL